MSPTQLPSPQALDFNNLPPGDSGRREAFEELVCQIAHRLPPADNAEWRRIHGAGGDGGVEAIWVLPEGTEHGYQAKFYTKSGEVNWSSIDDSVLTALRTHPKLIKITVAIACSLTAEVEGRSGRGRLPIPGWKHWDNHRNNWEAEAKAAGRAVTFELWTSPDLNELLDRPAARGLREHWFGALDLSQDWMRAQFDRTAAALDERYQPDDHVDVATSDVFDGLRRSSALMERLRIARTLLLEASGIRLLPEPVTTERRALSDRLQETIKILRDCKSDLNLPPGASFPTKKWLAICADLDALSWEALSLVDQARQRAKDAGQNKPAEPGEARDTDTIVYAHHQLYKFKNAIDQLSDILKSRSKQADEFRFAIVIGRAGTGKSHLLASEVEKAISDGAPCLFLLGTDFGQVGPIESQILHHYELSVNNFDVLLGAMDAAAERAETRGLIVIDAINEGAGATLWRNRLKSFADRVLAYSHLSLCVSCRTEYEQYLLTETVEKAALKVIVRGFETEAEQEQAATVYMDRRGIVRPATPWLNPEFVNPLFLRTTCLALAKEGRHEFPRGLRGMQEVMRFFLNGIARYLGTDYDGTDELQPAIIRAVLSLASKMASDQRDYVERATAARLIDESFRDYAVPQGRPWIELLRGKGVLRSDPNPKFDSSDPLVVHNEIIRFSFQRFQDHLIVQALLRKVATPDHLFDQNGAFGFLLSGDGIVWQWSGALTALFVQVADRFRVELADHMPGGIAEWWNTWAVRDAFVESIRWRSTDAFTERTRVLLNSLPQPTETAALLVELSVVESHPWNARFIHRTLIQRTLAQRDSSWTTAINNAAFQDGHPVNRLVDWSLNIGIRAATDETLSLSLLALAWFLTSTSSRVRDRATKAVCAILVERAALFAPIMAAFRGCNDVYVTERLVAAAYGASCRDPTPERLRLFSRVIYTEVFKVEEVVPAFLLRDYARGIIDLAESLSAIDSDVDAARCRPPYRSSVPRLSRSDKQLKALAKRVGAERILSSCYDGLADFGRYVVEGRVQRFSNALLSGPRPLTPRETMERFQLEVIAGIEEREIALRAVIAAKKSVRIILTKEPFSICTNPDDEARFSAAQKNLCTLLNPTERKRFKVEALPAIKNSQTWSLPDGRKVEVIDAAAAKRWIARRAISIGWTKDLFPSEYSNWTARAQGSKVERIGKKYQRIALGELLARLSDNYWLAPDYGGPSRIYNDPLSVSFTRDIDPTILPGDLVDTPPPQGMPAVPALAIREVEPDQLHDWVNEPNVAAAKLDLAIGTEPETQGWVSLHRFASRNIHYDERGRLSFSLKQSEFHFVSLIMMPTGERDRLGSEASENKIDFHDFQASDMIDGPYLGELGLRPTWSFGGLTELQARGSVALVFQAALPIVSYQWESHLDGSMPDGLSLVAPAPWVLASLQLRAAPNRLGVYVDVDARPAIVFGRTPRRKFDLVNEFALIRPDQLEKLSKLSGLVPVWTVLCERQAWPRQADSDSQYYSRCNGILWLRHDKTRISTWVRSP